MRINKHRDDRMPMNSLSMHVVDATTKEIKKTRRLIHDGTTRVASYATVEFTLKIQGEKSAHAEVPSRIRLGIEVDYTCCARLKVSRGVTRPEPCWKQLPRCSSQSVCGIDDMPALFPPRVFRQPTPVWCCR